MNQEFDNNVLDLVKQKGFYRHEYVSNFGKVKKELPSKENICSSLTDTKITDKEYEHVTNVWKIFEIKGMKDCHDFYLRCHILLLADVFEKIRNNSLKSYSLYPSHNLSTPGPSWDAMLKMTNIRLEHIPDPDMYIFFEKVKRGGNFLYFY